MTSSSISASVETLSTPMLMGDPQFPSRRVQGVEGRLFKFTPNPFGKYYAAIKVYPRGNNHKDFSVAESSS